MTEQAGQKQPGTGLDGSAQHLKRAQWIAEIAQNYVEGVELMTRGERVDGMQSWLKVWQELQFFWTDEANTLARAQAELGDEAFDVATMVRDMLEVWRDLIAEGRGSSAQAAAFVEEVRARFRAQAGDFSRQMHAELAYFLGLADRLDEAREICERLIAASPAHARPYLTLADVYLAQEPAQVEQAVEVLQRALDHPVDQASELGIAARLEALGEATSRAD